MIIFTSHIFCLLILFASFRLSQQLQDLQEQHVARTFSNNEIGTISSLYNGTYFNDTLSRILIPRVVGTPGHHAVKEFIIQELKDMGYDLEEDKFTALTPRFGNLTFTNIIGRLNPSARRYLMLSCHYDSLYMEQRFDGATDSAVPCAMILQIAKVLQPILSNSMSNELSLMLVFFDGEEAFVKWTSEDSLYGSRHLAAKWERTADPKDGKTASVLDSIDMMLLLDLLGARDPKLASFFPKTEKWHRLLVGIEEKLRAMGGIPSDLPSIFIDQPAPSGVDDDHIPFLKRGVPILYMIPVPFPSVWHTQADNFSALDFPTIVTLNKILQVFTLAYLEGRDPPAKSTSGSN